MSARPVLPLLALCLVAAVLGACGRRGPLESPSAVAAPAQRTAARGDVIATRPGRAVEGQGNAPGQAQVDDAEEPTADALVPNPVPTPTRSGGRRGYAVPREPFFLDPIL